MNSLVPEEREANECVVHINLKLVHNITQELHAVNPVLFAIVVSDAP